MRRHPDQEAVSRGDKTPGLFRLRYVRWHQLCQVPGDAAVGRSLGTVAQQKSYRGLLAWVLMDLTTAVSGLGQLGVQSPL